jgi:hypothetical protein
MLLTRVAEEMLMHVPQLNAVRITTSVQVQLLPVATDNTRWIAKIVVEVRLHARNKCVARPTTCVTWLLTSIAAVENINWTAKTVEVVQLPAR